MCVTIIVILFLKSVTVLDTGYSAGHNNILLILTRNIPPKGSSM